MKFQSQIDEAEQRQITSQQKISKLIEQISELEVKHIQLETDNNSLMNKLADRKEQYYVQKISELE